MKPWEPRLKRSPTLPKWAISIAPHLGSLFFSKCLMVIRGMKRLGCYLTETEHAAMHYFWRYAGYLLGVREELLTESFVSIVPFQDLLP